MTEAKKKVKLVLGSGGARGIAHIGVIEMLLQDGYEIVEVVGCSMGAVIGGLYCSGNLMAYKEWLLKQSKTDIYRLFDIAFSTKGLVRGERIFGILKQMMGDHLIEHFSIPFCAVATDMMQRKEVHFRSGDLYKALRASTGIPGVFTPVSENNCLYVDGGVLNPLPVDLVQKTDDTIIVAVSLNGAFENEQPMETKDEETPAETEAGMLTRLRNYFYAPTPVPKTPAVPDIINYSMFELFSASYDSSLDRIVDLTLQLHPVDILVEIPRNVCSVFDFYRSEAVIEAGRKCYTKAAYNYQRMLPEGNAQ